MAESYNPDVLTCLANLSNDEVFTPPAVVNAMLDLLPQELFASPKTRFLDPAAKSGVFLREIAKRLIKGLERDIPDLQKRVDHILHNQVFGIATTELTSLVSRRTLYCSKYPNCRYSVSPFDTVEGNIRFRALRHTFVKGRCKWCGASESQFDRDESLESHAYEFIHISNPQEIFNMKFDVIIGNPPYQINVGVEKENYAIPIYHRFVQQAKALNPRFLVMIIPARWYAGGRGLDEFRDEMLHDVALKEMHDFPNSCDCFPSVDISGGICYFIRDNAFHGQCKICTHDAESIISTMNRELLEPDADTFIRHNAAIPILRKVRAFNEESFENLVSAQTPFGLISSFNGYKIEKSKTSIKYYTYGHEGYVERSQVSRNFQWVNGHKVYVSAAYGERGPYPYFFLGKPFYGEPQSCCSQSYLHIGAFSSKTEACNVISYIKTRFFRFMIMLKKNAQHNMRTVFGFIPLQDFSKHWTDEELYKKYKLTKDEIEFIESMVKPME